MRRFLIVACAVAGAAAGVNAQTQTSFAQPVSLSACSPVAAAEANRFIAVRPSRARSLSRTAGSALLYVAHGVRVAGGLVPSTNLAAQAGSIDPTVPAMAMVSGDPYRSDLAARRVPVRDISPGAPPMRVECPPR